MTSQSTHDVPPQQAGAQGEPARHRGHGWMMIACCIPMIAIFVALWAAGIVPASFLLAAFACTALMALMMRGMSGGEGHAGHQADEETRR